MGEDGGMNKTKINRVSRALERVSSEPAERGCLLWLGAVNTYGYGEVRFGEKRVGAHRLAFAFGLRGERHGAMPPPEVVIRHRCDTPRCCNPSHLQAGSQADNIRDRDERGHCSRGESHGNATLTDAAVARVHELRAEGLLQREIAVLVGCGQPHVSSILRGRTRAPR